MTPKSAARPGESLVAKKVSAPRLALNVEEACESLSISWDTWREHVEPDVRIVRVGRRKLIAVAELERWLAENAESTLEQRR
jgi:hypothetical protein